MKSYTCPICQKSHKIYPGLELPPPSWINELSPAEKEARVKAFDGLKIVDKTRVFLKVTVEIFLEQEDNLFFSWNCWGETSLQAFGPLFSKLQQGETVSFTGTMPQIPMYYEPGEDLACTFTMYPEGGRTIATVETDSRIKEDQSRPITKDRLIELMNGLHHRSGSDKFDRDDRPFTDRLLELIQKAKTDFIDQGKQVCITVHHDPAIGLQIVSSGVLEFMDEGAIGFGLHLPFDNEKAVMEQFKKHDQYGEYHYHVWDGTPTWQRNFGLDKGAVMEVTQALLIEVYEVDVEELDLDIFEL